MRPNNLRKKSLSLENRSHKWKRNSLKRNINTSMNKKKLNGLNGPKKSNKNSKRDGKRKE